MSMPSSQPPQMTDWDQAYDNRAAVGLAKVEAQIADWTTRASEFRAELTSQNRARLDQPYGDGDRHRFDLFLPEGATRGLVVFGHGGYWRSFDKSLWSHLAAGALGHGFAVAVPSYSLCPEVRVRDITQEFARFVTVIAGQIDGEIRLVGHSAGGHLVARMVSGALAPALARRIAKVISISGVHDLRPLLRTSINQTLGLDLAEARAESPALLEPIEGVDLLCWAGGDELPAFRAQNRLLADIWHGLGAGTEAVEAPGRHHFDVIAPLADPASDLVAAVLG